jgi:hypothetical protein
VLSDELRKRVIFVLAFTKLDAACEQRQVSEHLETNEPNLPAQLQMFHQVRTIRRLLNLAQNVPANGGVKAHHSAQPIRI